MKALVKAKARPRHLARGHARAQGRPQRRADQDRARPRSAAPTCTSTTGTPGRRRPSPCRWPSATSTAGAIVEIGSEVQGLEARRPRLGRGPHHLRLLPQLPRRAPPPVPQHRRRRRQPPGRLRRVPRDPGRQRLQASRRASPTTSPPILDPFGNATHTALSFNLVGEDVLITGAGPDRHHGRGHRAPRRRAPRRDHRRQRLPPGARAQDGRDARRQRRSAKRSTDV